MLYNEFLDLIKKEISNMLGEEVNVEINSVIKNNGLVYDGLVILSKDTMVTPTIYLNEYYNEYIAGNKDIEGIVNEVLEMYEQHRNDLVDFQYDFRSFESIKDRIVFRLVNREMNKGLLEIVPHREFLDLELVYYVLFDSVDGMNVTTTINNKLVALWEVTEEEIYEVAYENTREKLGCQIMPMNNIIKEILFEKGAFEHQEELEEILRDIGLENRINMYVLTNETRNLGASGMVYRDVLREFSRSLEKDFYILPSSIHEIIIIPKEGEYSVEELGKMVSDVNSTEVHPSEVLSDNVYEYISKRNEIIVHKKCI